MSVSGKATCPDGNQIQCYFNLLDSSCVGPGLQWAEVRTDPRPLKIIDGNKDECVYETNTGEKFVFLTESYKAFSETLFPPYPSDKEIKEMEESRGNNRPF